MRGLRIWLPWTAAVGLVALLTWSGIFHGARSSRPASGVNLADLIGPVRLAEPRLTGGFQWKPLPAPGDNKAEPARAKARLRAVAYLEAMKKHEPRDESDLASLGAAQLLAGDIDAAVETLETVLAATGPSAATLNDLAAAYFIQARKKEDPERLVRALDAAARARRIDPDLLEARFNYALILDSTGPPSIARDAWTAYLADERAPGWRVEAEVRRSGRPAGTGPSDVSAQTARENLEDKLLVEWSTAILAGDRELADRRLVEARALASVASGHGADTYARDLVDEVGALEGADVQSYALAYRDGQKGKEMIVSANQIESGRKLLTTAASHLGRTAGPLAESLEFWTIFTDWYRLKPDQIDRPLAALIARTTEARHGYLTGRAQLVLGSVRQRQTRYSDAIDAYRCAVQAFTSGGERDMESSSRMLLAAGLREQGLWREAWKNEMLALGRLDAMKRNSQRDSVLREAIRLCLAQSRTEAAGIYADVLLREARRWQDHGVLFIAASLMARVELQRGDPQAARAALADAEHEFESIGDRAYRNSHQLDLRSLRAEVFSRSAPDAAVTNARALVQGAHESGSLFRRVRGYWLLGRAAEAAGRDALAIDAWKQGIAALEDDNLRVREEQLRIARTSDVWGIYEGLVRTLVRLGRPREGLAIAERGRARALTASALRNVEAAGGPPPVPVHQLKDTIAYYLTLPDAHLIWVLRQGAVSLRQQPGGARRIRVLVASLDLSARTESDPTAALTELYRLLISPIEDLLRDSERIAIVPDGPLSVVPFAALKSPRTRRFMIEDHEMILNPSLALLQLSTARTRRSILSFEHVLAAGDPSLEFEAGLPALPGARREAEAIAAIYHERPLVGGQLTRNAFLSSARLSDLVHFTGHAIADTDYPSRSYLALAGPGEEGRLTPDRIRPADFGGTHLVVLSACSTGSGEVERGEGVLSLARPFLAAGVPFVLATLRPVDDRITPMLIGFHEYLRTGYPPARALRLAQIDQIRQGHSFDLNGWAAFQMFGNLETETRGIATEGSRKPH